MSLVGLDLNASRARAVTGSETQQVALVRLDGERLELPLALSLQERTPRVGHVGQALTRTRPHLTCQDYFAFVGTGRTWHLGRHQFDADRAVEWTFTALARLLGRASALAVVWPAYLTEAQLVQLMRLAEKAGLPIVGSLAAPIAAALGVPGLTARPDPGLVLVVDVDAHALTWSIVERGGGQFRLRMIQPAPHLGRSAWLRRLLDTAAARCVRQSRRDPRESAETEQSLYEQLLELLDRGGARATQLHLQGPGWFHTLLFHEDDLSVLVSPLLRQTLGELDGLLATIESLGPLDAVVVTHAAAGLPGLVSLLQTRVRHRPRSNAIRAIDDEADYGASLLRVLENENGFVRVVEVDTPACVAHELAMRIQRGDFARGHLDCLALPQQDTQRVRDTGPPRVAFRGHEHVLPAGSFSLGRDPACDLVFETELYPHVSARHAEIVYERCSYVLRDRSRHGTLLNDRPVQQQAALHSGDWIRLGPRGPVLRFLGDSTC